MNNNIIIAVDAGKYMLKSIGKKFGTDEEIKQISFFSKSHTTNDINEEYEGNSYKVNYDNKITILGDSGEKYDYESNKEKDLHKLCTYVSITKFLKPNTKNNNIYMVLACPIDFIRNKELKDSYKAFIKGDGEININVNDENYTFTIKDITIKTEGSGVIYNDPQSFQDKEIALIDLGGVNFSFCIYNNCVAVKETRFARDIGGNKLNQMTRNALRDYTKGKQISSKLAEKSLKEGYLTLAEKEITNTKEIIENVKKEYLQKIIDEINQSGYELDTLKPVFTGGTTEIISATIKKQIQHADVTKNAQWNSVEGFYVISNNKYSELLKNQSEE